MRLVTVMGIVLPITMLAISALADLRALAIASALIAIVSPSLGHVVYRRTLRTRGCYVRLAGTAFAGLLVLLARNARSFESALGLVGVCLVVIVVAFVAGAILDVVDCDQGFGR